MIFLIMCGVVIASLTLWAFRLRYRLNVAKNRVLDLRKRRNYYLDRLINEARAKRRVICEAKRQCRRAEFAEALLNELFEPYHYPELGIQVTCVQFPEDGNISLYPDKDEIVLEIVEDGKTTSVTLDSPRIRRLVANMIPYVGGASFEPLTAPAKVAV